MEIEYTNISREDYYKLSDKEKKAKPYCIEYPSRKEWLVNGKFHREDGPAIEWCTGKVGWYLNYANYTFEEWLEKTPLSNEEKVFLRLKYEN